LPSQDASPVLHDWCGWSPYQQHTSAALVIESPMAAMVPGRGGVVEAAAHGPDESPASDRSTTRASRLRMSSAPSVQAGTRCRLQATFPWEETPKPGQRG